ncbi:hypothetical protein CAP39_13690 [Sphingomonas sp. IBVSS1]|nr:hypothetical protein CAP39_13690 [Sphingomonas sp. IBVSS1]
MRINHPGCMAIGGPGLDVLSVASARDGWAGAVLADQRHAGDVRDHEGRAPAQLRDLPASHVHLAAG